MKVDWQVYSPVRKEVVAHISTSGDIKISNSVADGMAQLITGVFASNARALVDTAEFRAAVSAKPLAPPGCPAERAAEHDRVGAAKDCKTVNCRHGWQRGDADDRQVISGSGVLLSSDGYVLTNAHVVGDEKELRVRWPDGIEKVGQVIRVSKPRDVAPVKTDLRQGTAAHPAWSSRSWTARLCHWLAQGQGIEGTVSAGVVSASRTIEGMRHPERCFDIARLQRGRCWMKQARCSALRKGILKLKAVPAGLNMFIPIGDAMDFLSLEQDWRRRFNPSLTIFRHRLGPCA